MQRAGVRSRPRRSGIAFERGGQGGPMASFRPGAQAREGSAPHHSASVPMIGIAEEPRVQGLPATNLVAGSHAARETDHERGALRGSAPFSQSNAMSPLEAARKVFLRADPRSPALRWPADDPNPRFFCNADHGHARAVMGALPSLACAPGRQDATAPPCPPTSGQIPDRRGLLRTPARCIHPLSVCGVQ